MGHFVEGKETFLPGTLMTGILHQSQSDLLKLNWNISVTFMDTGSLFRLDDIQLMRQLTHVINLQGLNCQRLTHRKSWKVSMIG